MMNTAQGSPSPNTKPIRQKEESADTTEGDDFQPKDMTTDKGYKPQRSSLPFSVESLISKKTCTSAAATTTTTCRTHYPPPDLGLVVSPKPKAAAAQIISPQFSPRTFYAERKVCAESSQSASSSPVRTECPQFCEKDQSTWFPGPGPFPTPPRKYYSPIYLNSSNGYFLVSYAYYTEWIRHMNAWVKCAL